MDKINAPIYFKPNKHIALVDLKAMNKKFAFIVVQNGPRKTELIRVFKTTDAQIAVASF